MVKRIMGMVMPSQRKASLYDNLEKVLFEWPGTKEKYRISHSLAGVLAQGASRSGKSSAVAKFIVKNWFKAGFGGLYFATRVGDADTIKKWAEDAGRANDIIIFNRDSDFKFNFMEFEMGRTDIEEQNINAIVDNLLRINELIANFKGMGSSKNEEAFWKETFTTFVTNSISLMLIAGVNLSMSGLRRFILDGFNEEDVTHYYKLISLQESSASYEEKRQAFNELQDWRDESSFLDCFLTANERTNLDNDEYNRMQELGDYWLRQYPKLASKTKSIVVEMSMSVCRPFQNGILKSHFTGGFNTELHPDRTIFERKIIIVDFGVKQFGTEGVCGSGIIKMLYQQAWERRDLRAEGPNANPVMLFIDEFQYYINKKEDTLFTSTAGGSLVCNFLITQNIDNIIMQMGDSSPESAAKSLCGNLSTKIFCANSNVATNSWASEMIGQYFVDAQTTSISNGDVKKSFAQIMQPKVPVSHFMMLKTGRKEHNYNVETIIVQTGRAWKNGENFQQVTFSQKY
ncbi:MAG: TraM recognition domain-containing protein [Gelidibacter sp.]|nr:TraM recognition domain-containing protein [Gelidibacter sp.]